jgi:hypothetical protein
MTPARLRRLCKQIVAELDPDGSAKRREAAERDGARVEFFAEHGGSGALFATGLPPDEALRSEANIQKRAGEYRGVGLYPDDSMDLLRVLALIDTINGRTPGDRIAIWNSDQDDSARRGEEEMERRRRDGQYPEPPPGKTAAETAWVTGPRRATSMGMETATGMTMGMVGAGTAVPSLAPPEPRPVSLTPVCRRWSISRFRRSPSKASRTGPGRLPATEPSTPLWSGNSAKQPPPASAVPSA